ncbi:MAG: ferric reductase-like transmembrane domain-containing protein [Woeseiaceae bacterium]|nr:ferric reductase-like transmembrane domain-containing protein [Woeseiaceae bacterium]
MPSRAARILNSKYTLWVVLTVPFLWLSNSIRELDLNYGHVLHASGVYSARLLLLTLAITPLRLMFAGATWPGWFVARRRYFGVAAFAYAALHTLVYLDRKLGSGLVLEEAQEFSMWTGWLAFIIFVPLALTSNDAAVHWLQRKWKLLHWWIYPAAVLSFVHWTFAAFDFLPGLLHLGVLFLLESYRIWKRRRLRLSSPS